MKSFLAPMALLMFVSSAAFAIEMDPAKQKPVELSVEVIKDGKTVATPMMKATPGQPGSFQQMDDGAKNGYKIAYRVSVLGSKDSVNLYRIEMNYTEVAAGVNQPTAGTALITKDHIAAIGKQKVNKDQKTTSFEFHVTPKTL